MATLAKLSSEIDRINARNRKVEADKAWETSWTKRLLLVIFTYLAVGLYLNAINLPNAWITAVVPSVGFMLSTLTLPYFKRAWLGKIYENK